MADNDANGTAVSEAAAEAAYKAELKARLSGEKAPAPVETKTEPTSTDEDQDDTADSDEDTSSELAADSEDEDQADTDEEDSGEVDEAALAALSKKERTFKAYKKAETEKLEAERAKLIERERAVQEEAKNLRAYIAAIKHDPFGTLIQDGLIDEDAADHISRQLYLHFKGKSDPKLKAEAERLRKDREAQEALLETKREIERLRQEREEEKEAARQEKILTDYTTRLDESTRLHKDSSPLLAKALEKDPAETKRELYLLAHELGVANEGNFVEPAKVLARWEKLQRERLARLGYSVPEPVSKSKAKSPNAAKKQGQSATSTSATSADEQALSDEEYRAGLRKRLGH